MASYTRTETLWEIALSLDMQKTNSALTAAHRIQTLDSYSKTTARAPFSYLISFGRVAIPAQARCKRRARFKDNLSNCFGHKHWPPRHRKSGARSKNLTWWS